MKSQLKTWTALVAACVFVLPAAAQTTYNDVTNEIISASILDIESVEVSNTAFDIVFKINLVGNPVDVNWGKYMIGVDSAAGGDTAGNGWGRPISMASGMDHWLTAWMDTDPVNGQIWHYSASWNQDVAAPNVSRDASSVSISVPMAGLGLAVNDSFDFDVYTSGGGGGDGAIDALSASTQTISDWGQSFATTNNLTYTITPVPTPTNVITFSVDMQVPIAIFDADPFSSDGFDPEIDRVYLRGAFNGWAGTAHELQRVGTTSVFTNTFEVIGELNSTMEYKFFAADFPAYGYEVPQLSCGGNRTLVITNSTMSAPLAYWNDSQVTDPTNVVTFQVDMEVPTATGTFVPGSDSVYLRGDFQGWSEPGVLLTNVPSTTLYAGTLELPYFPEGGCKPLTYKFLINNNYETINNRQTNVTSLNPVLTSRFNNINFCDVTDVTNQVTFSVNMAGAVGTDQTVYDGTQTVYLNGNFAGWWAWGNTNGVATNYVMQKSGDIYSLTVPMPPGTDLRMQYKYSLDGNDNEASFGQDHIRYIRTLPGQTAYTLPQDTWTGTNSPQHEVRFGNLVAVPGASGEVQIEWLGLKCVELQSATSLSPADWADVENTSGLSQTNLPTVELQQFFRLVDPSP